MHRCSAAGVQAFQWKDRDVAGSDLGVVSVEYLENKAYVTFVREKLALGELLAIFLHEVHLNVQWRNFLEFVAIVKTKVQPAGVVQTFYALSATFSPTLRQNIAAARGLKDWT